MNSSLSPVSALKSALFVIYQRKSITLSHNAEHVNISAQTAEKRSQNTHLSTKMVARMSAYVAVSSAPNINGIPLKSAESLSQAVNVPSVGK